MGDMQTNPERGLGRVT